MVDYKSIICKGYCKYGEMDRADKCKECGDFCKSFEQSEFADYMVGEELMESVKVIYERYMLAQIERFKNEER